MILYGAILGLARGNPIVILIALTLIDGQWSSESPQCASFAQSMRLTSFVNATLNF